MKGSGNLPTRSDMCKKRELGRSRFLRRTREVHEMFRQNGYAELSWRQTPWSAETLYFLLAYFKAMKEAGYFYKDSQSDPRALLSACRWSLDNDRLAVHLSVNQMPGNSIFVSVPVGGHLVNLFVAPVPHAFLLGRIRKIIRTGEFFCPYSQPGCAP